LHFDVMDGRFVPELYLGPLIVRELRKYATVPMEVHLLVAEPDRCAEQYLDAGADCIFAHIEAAEDPAALLERLRGRRCKAGLAIAPQTSAERLRPYLPLCDGVNVMTVTPGVPGALNEAGVRNLQQVARMVRGLDHRPFVQVDGAVSAATRDRFIACGAAAMVAGYPIFSRDDFNAAVVELRQGVVVPDDAPTRSDSKR